MLDEHPARTRPTALADGARFASPAVDHRSMDKRSAMPDGLPFWLRSCVGLAYAAVGAAHLIVGTLIGAADKPAVLVAVIVMLIVNLATLDIWRARLSRWWSSAHHRT